MEGRPKWTAADTTGATGVYLTSEGVKGGAVWSTRGRWCILTGNDADKHVVTIAMIDNPGESWLSDVLACARVWIICCESTGAEHLRSEAACVQLHH